MRLEEARRVAGIVVDLLAPACTKIAVAGSVRREKPEDIKDIEIVALPDARPARPVFGMLGPATLFGQHVGALIDRGALRYDTTHPMNGPLRMKLRHPASGAKIDLFLAHEDNYGCIMAIRTGDADFSKLLVTDVNRGGLMPCDMAQRDGYLHEIIDEYNDRIIPCPDEAAFFTALGFHDVPLPSVRDWAFAQGLRRAMERKGAA